MPKTWLFCVAITFGEMILKKLLSAVSVLTLVGCNTTPASKEAITTTRAPVVEAAPAPPPPASPNLAPQQRWDGSYAYAQVAPQPSQVIVAQSNPSQNLGQSLGNGQTVEVLPSEYETITETVVVQNAATELVVSPPVYDWVDGEIPGSSVEYVSTPPVYETVTETIVTQEASTELVVVPAVLNPDGSVAVPARTVERSIPAVTKTETRRVVKTPASTREKIVPNIIKDGRTRIQISPGNVTEKIVTPGQTQEITRRVPKGDPKYVLKDEHGSIIRVFDSQEAFEKFATNPYKRVVEEPVSTFSSDVDTASYSVARRRLKAGRLPEKDSIRIEEILNYFDYDYPKPKSKHEPFKPSINIVDSPWNAQTKLIHIGVQGYEPPKSKRPPMNLVFLVDTSGSMKNPDKLPLLKQSLNVLIGNLAKEDRVSIVTYGSKMETVLVPTAGNRKSDIRAALEPLHAHGGTNGEAGLQQAYRVAEQSFISDGTNRVILATDGDFNIGISDPTELKRFVEDKRDSKIYLSVLGFGQGNLKDDRMQALAQNGNGVAYYIDGLNEAQKVFGSDFSKSLVPIADDLKLQVEFNRELVSEYRLLGYETRALARQDFNNDKVDAGDIGSGHSVTAIYEILPAGVANGFVDPLRYGQAFATPTRSKGIEEEYGFLKLRYKRPGEDESNLMSAPILKEAAHSSLSSAPRETRWAVAVGGYGMALRGDDYADNIDIAELSNLAKGAKGRDKYGYRSEFLDLIKTVNELKN